MLSTSNTFKVGAWCPERGGVTKQNKVAPLVASVLLLLVLPLLLVPVVEAVAEAADAGGEQKQQQ